MPFYPSPDRDDGYDVTDFYGVDHRLGTMGDLVEFIRRPRTAACGSSRISWSTTRPTSTRGSWKPASPMDNPYRDYYVWRKDTPPDTSSEVVFPGEQTSLWTQDDATGEWYLHMFAEHQPDLNVTTPRSGTRSPRPWDSGWNWDWTVSGSMPCRSSSKPAASPRMRRQGSTRTSTWSALRSFVSRRNGSAVLLGEVNLPYKEQLEYFGGAEGNELNMQFDFMSMQHIYLSLARGDARPLAETLKSRPRAEP